MVPFVVLDPFLASYGVENPLFAITQLAQTTMCNELGKITLDKSFKGRPSLDRKIVKFIKKDVVNWGLECLRYEIRDITPSKGVGKSMDLLVELERKKNAQILIPQGEAQGVIARAEALSQKMNMLSVSITDFGGFEAACLITTEDYIKAFGNIA